MSLLFFILLSSHHFLVLSPVMVGQRSLVGYSPWGCKELDTTEHTHTQLVWINLFLLFFIPFSPFSSPFPFSVSLLPPLVVFLPPCPSFSLSSPPHFLPSFHGLPWSVGFPRGSTGKESACNAEDPGSIPGLGRSPGEGISYPPQYSWASVVTQTVKNLPAMWETWVRSLGWEDPLEQGKATHSSILAWRIPWTVWSMRLQRVGHDWATFSFTLHAVCSVARSCPTLRPHLL